MKYNYFSGKVILISNGFIILKYVLLILISVLDRYNHVNESSWAPQLFLRVQKGS